MSTVLNFRLVAFLHSHGVPFQAIALGKSSLSMDRKVEVAFLLPDSAEVTRLIAEFNENSELDNYLRAEKIVRDAMFETIRQTRFGRSFRDHRIERTTFHEKT